MRWSMARPIQVSLRSLFEWMHLKTTLKIRKWSEDDDGLLTSASPMSAHVMREGESDSGKNNQPVPRPPARVIYTVCTHTAKATVRLGTVGAVAAPLLEKPREIWVTTFLLSDQ
ncbi:hypothetical protein CDAR_292141 [Caerostris darwini]|uniref:Uncharacterized protein n=1 Tax=Caerostris darwini TaxID=1538125 RepID=A0AAV4V3I1_9ARAC|nr:hypothetical protein CDAR_292141 [Caerostris darwini]